jgi:ferredoxin
MVGGILYFRGNASGISTKDVKIMHLAKEDITYLDGKIDDFLTSIARLEIRNVLSNWAEWYKVVPLKYDERSKTTHIEILPFRMEEWIPKGIFSDVLQDDFSVIGLVTRDVYRQRVPVWEHAYYPDVPKADEDYLRCISCGTCRDCHMCERSCPENAITRMIGADGDFEYSSDSHKCIGCGICAGICPCGIWSMHDNKQPILNKEY